MGYVRYAGGIFPYAIGIIQISAFIDKFGCGDILALAVGIFKRTAAAKSAGA
jgi:hypothetical protein